MATIIDAPPQLRAAQATLSAGDTLAESRSVYSGAEARLDFGGEFWRLTLTTRPMPAADAMAVAAWCDRLREADAVARLAPPAAFERRGTSAATVLTVTANAGALARTLAVSGLGAGLTLGAGTFVAIADRLHRVRNGVTGDAATLSLFPRLRAAATIGAQVFVGPDVRGLFRLAGRPDLDLDYGARGRIVGPMTLSFVEAINL